MKVGSPYVNGLKYLLLCWVLSILVRLPQLNRPLAKHHEYNTAVILMNIETWRTAGGGDQFHYIPVLNYPNPGDRFPSRSNELCFDPAGNTLYFSFGAAWYLVPYFLYQLFHWPAVPLYLQILNLLLHGLGAWLWWRWLHGPTRTHLLSPAARQWTVLAYLCLPGMLWYNGNGYVNTSLSLPLLITWLMVAERWNSNRTTGRYLLYALVSLLCVYTDWFIVFLSASVAFWEAREKKLPIQEGLAQAFYRLAPVGLGVVLIVAQYSSYVGLNHTLQALGSRFSNRSFMEGSPSVGSLWFSFFGHYGTLYLPILIGLLVASFKQIRKRLFNDIFFVAYGSALVAYHLILFQWSAIHEFAMLADVLWILYAMGLLLSSATPKQIRYLAIPFVVVCLAQFYWINRPGRKSRDGMPYQQYQRFGASLQKLPKTATLFMDRAWTAELQYHAKRSIQPVADEQSARKCMSDWKITEAYWIEHEGYQILAIRPLHP